MTDITIADQDEIEKYEDIMINMFYHLFSYNYNLGLFTDDSSVYDMKYFVLVKDDYLRIANLFEEQNKEEFDYFQSEKIYNKILNDFFVEKIAKILNEKYDYSFTKEKHLLKTLGKELKEQCSNKNWQEENVFMLKVLDNKAKNQVKVIEQEKEKTNVVHFPKRKKLNKEEILQSTNFFLMMNELDMNYDDAKELSNKNLKEKMKDKKFQPYIPEM